MWLLLILSQIEPDTWGTLVRNFGVPGAFLAVALLAIVRGWLITAREAAKDKSSAEQRESEWQKRYEKMETEKNFWRDSSLKLMDSLEVTTKTASRAVDRMPNDPTAGGNR